METLKGSVLELLNQTMLWEEQGYPVKAQPLI